MNGLILDSSFKNIHWVVVKNKNAHGFFYQTKDTCKDLLVTLDESLKKAQSKLEDFSFFSVVNGPGSFTSTRIAVSTIKGLAFMENKIVVALNALDVMAFDFFRRHGLSTQALSLIPSRKGHCYVGFYEMNDSYILVNQKPIELKVDEMASRFDFVQWDGQSPCVFSNQQGIERISFQERLCEQALWMQTLQKLNNKEYLNEDTIDANYIV